MGAGKYRTVASLYAPPAANEIGEVLSDATWSLVRTFRCNVSSPAVSPTTESGGKVVRERLMCTARLAGLAWVDSYRVGIGGKVYEIVGSQVDPETNGPREVVFTLERKAD